MKVYSLKEMNGQDLARHCQRLGYQVWNLVNKPTATYECTLDRIKAEFENTVNELKRRKNQ